MQASENKFEVVKGDYPATAEQNFGVLPQKS
jgi:hypothetical protein